MMMYSPGGSTYNSLPLIEVRKEQRRVACLLRANRLLPPPMKLRYHRRHQVSLLESVSELPEDVTKRISADNNSDPSRQELPSSFRCSIPDVLGTCNSYGGGVRPQDIRRFSYDSLLTRSLDELRGRNDEEPRRRRIASLCVIPPGGGRTDDGQTYDFDVAHLHLRRGVVGQLTDMVDKRGGRVKHNIPTFAFSPSSRFANDGLLSTPQDNELDFLGLGSVIDDPSLTVPGDLRRARDYSLTDDTTYIEDDRTSLASSLSDVSTLQRLYGPRLSPLTTTSMQAMMSGKSIRSTRSGHVTSGHWSERCSRSSRGNANSEVTSYRSHVTGSTHGVRFMLPEEESRRFLDPHSVELEKERKLSDRKAINHQPSAGHVIVLPQVKRKRRSRYSGEISRAFVYSYFTALPGITHSTSPQDSQD